MHCIVCCHDLYKSKVTVDLYSALSRETHACNAQAWHVLMRITQFYLPPTRLSTSGMSHTCLYPPAAQRHRTLADTHFPSHWGVEGWDGLSGWLQTQVVCPPADGHSPSISWAQRTVTSLIETNALPLNQAATTYSLCYQYFDCSYFHDIISTTTASKYHT